MKIVQILPELNAGGVERGTLEIAAHLVRAGHESIVISNGGRMVAELEQAGSRHIRMPVHRKAPASLGQIPRLREIFAEEKPDLIHVRSRLPAWLAWLAWKSLDRRTRPRFITTVHGFYSVNAYSAVMTRGERVIAVSESVRDYILKNYPKSPPENIRVIPRGVDPGDYGVDFRPAAEWLARWRAQQPGLAEKCVLLLPGRITRLKGHEDFFHLIDDLKNAGFPVHGLIAGDAHEKKRAYLEELRELARTLGLGADITFLGHRADIREVMSVCDIICALSQQPESFGRTVLEAMALGKPVVGYDCGGVGELLGSLFPDGRVPLGDRVRLLETARCVMQNQRRPLPAGEPFTCEAMCRATLGVYRELVC
jgi:glycosyltransferase involved in cell wall biosynthesis